MMRVGVIGLGVMGRPMAANLMRAGFPGAVYARPAAPAESLAPRCATAREPLARPASRCAPRPLRVTAQRAARPA